MGRGGRIILDRAHHELDDFWRTVDFTIYEPTTTAAGNKTEEEIVTNLSDTRLNCYSNSECDDRLRTNSNSSSIPLSLFSGGVTVKNEPIEVKEEEDGEQTMVVEAETTSVKEEDDDVMEFLKTVRKEW